MSFLNKSNVWDQGLSYVQPPNRVCPIKCKVREICGIANSGRDYNLDNLGPRWQGKESSEQWAFGILCLKFEKRNIAETMNFMMLITHLMLAAFQLPNEFFKAKNWCKCKNTCYLCGLLSNHFKILIQFADKFVLGVRQYAFHGGWWTAFLDVCVSLDLNYSISGERNPV